MLPSGPLVEDVERIAVLRGNALGDLVVALPALDALRAAYPHAEITLLGRAHHAALLGTGRHSPVDRVVPLPQGAIGDEPAVDPGLDRPALLATLVAEGYDLAIQMHGGGRHSNGFLLELGARITAGSRTADAPDLDRWVPYEHLQWEVARYLEIVGLVGAAPMAIEPHLAVEPDDLDAVAAALPELGGDAYVVLHPGATDPRRRWPVERFAAVGRHLREAGERLVITGISAERELTEALVDALGPEDGEGPVLAQDLPLPALVGLLADASLVVANDTGPLHLAMAVGTPTVGIFWIGNLVNAGPFTRRLHRPVVSWRVACPVCGVSVTAGRCEHDVTFVDDVDTDAVMRAAGALLEAAP